MIEEAKVQKEDLEAQRIAGKILNLLEDYAIEHFDDFCRNELIDIYEKAVHLVITQVKSPQERANHSDYLNWWRDQWGFEQTI